MKNVCPPSKYLYTEPYPSSRTRNKIKGNVASRMEFLFFLTLQRERKKRRSRSTVFEKLRARFEREERRKIEGKRERNAWKGGTAYTLEAYRRTERIRRKESGVSVASNRIPLFRHRGNSLMSGRGREGQIGGESNAIRMRVTQAIRECRDVTWKGGRDESFMKFRL